jgi:hypothetical protein
MFMLTHTYFLQKVLEHMNVKDVEPDIFVYNIATDLLTIHPRINPAQTHFLQRSLKIPARYPKSMYVIFHLLVDDLSHHGHICSGCQEEFSLNAQGYSYVKGSSLTEAITGLHKMIDKEISYGEAVYQSHLIIEMIYDLVIARHISAFKTVDVLVEAINYTFGNKMSEFVETMQWLYDLDENDINDVMKNALFFITREGMNDIMSIEGRMNLYRDKFGLKNDKPLFDENLKILFQRAMDLIDDDEQFFRETVQAVKHYNNFDFIT